MRQGMGVLWDFSAAGVGLLLRCHLEPGATLLLQLPAPPRGATHTRLARVAHATPLPGEGDTWLVGCRLTPFLSDRDFDRLRRLLTAARD
jgi:hypothetical protein